MKLLLVGKGHLARFLVEELDIPHTDVWQKRMALLSEEILLKIKPDVVVNTAAKTDLTWTEEHKTETWQSNVIEPLDLYRRISKVLPKTTFIHISSGCVWDGPYKADGSAFEPLDAVTPACFYSWSKAACDAILLQEMRPEAPLAILRPRQVYSPVISPRNTLTKLNTYKKLLKTPNSMTSASTIAKTIKVLADHGTRYYHPIFNVYDIGATSPFEVGRMLAEAGIREMPEELTKAELDSWHKPKRVDAVIQDKFFENYVHPPKIEDELARNIKIFATRHRQSTIRIKPFADVDQRARWDQHNCELCRKGIDASQQFPFLCSIKDEMFKTDNTTEDVSEDIAQRMGYQANSPQDVWRCPEFKPRE